ncbi:short-chain fatty acyl-CoA regulator family protein [Sphingomonas sp.]|uniref:helix-turn-helix domain-containing protein n=1 Tax=Sphingomonas sp. TaxID=28214 RepID=UPI0035BBAC3C
MARSRLYVGEQLRAARRDAGLNQRTFAERLGISVSYLSQLESGERPLTPAVAAALGRRHPTALAVMQGMAPAQRLAALAEALADPALPPVPPHDVLAKLAEERPEIADRIVALHAAKRAAEERSGIAEETMTAGNAARLPWEAVRDWFHDAGNYVDPLDRAAEQLAVALATGAAKAGVDDALVAALAGEGISLRDDPDEDAPLARFDARTLTLNATLPPESRRFQLAHRLAAITFADIIAAVVEAAPLPDIEARRLLRIGLANYAAGALVMPYEHFRTVARSVRHDIDRLSRRFGVSFEQACHRLSTLQRPGAEGIPFYFCRVDMAGNITKRHSATRMQFARFGGACPLWVVHEAVAIPDRILVQHSETPDGVRYVSMAKGLVKSSGSFHRRPRRYAVLLGCEAAHAADFVYADAIDRAARPVGIGPSCRLCPRPDCDQRAFPPADRAIAVEADVRRVVPYRIV